MFTEEQHDLADFPLLLPALANSFHSLLTDSFDVQEEIGGGLEDLECSLFMDTDDICRQLGADATNCPRGEVFFDAFGGGRMSSFQVFGLELLSMLLIHDPTSGGLNMFSCRYRCG